MKPNADEDDADFVVLVKVARKRKVADCAKQALARRSIRLDIQIWVHTSDLCAFYRHSLSGSGLCIK
jgi:hypothetical protein